MSRCHPESLLLLRDFLQVISVLVVGGWSPGMLLLPAPPCSFLLSHSPGSAALAGMPPAVASCIVFHFSPVLKSSSLVPSEVIN